MLLLLLNSLAVDFSSLNYLIHKKQNCILKSKYRRQETSWESEMNNLRHPLCLRTSNMSQFYFALKDREKLIKNWICFLVSIIKLLLKPHKLRRFLKTYQLLHMIIKSTVKYKILDYILFQRLLAKLNKQAARRATVTRKKSDRPESDRNSPF